MSWTLMDLVFTAWVILMVIMGMIIGGLVGVIWMTIHSGWYPGCGRTFWTNQRVDPDKWA